MKKRNEWVRKAFKRKKKEKDRGIVDFMMIMHHFFRELPAWVDEMKDPRHPSYITYSQSDLFYLGLMKNICGVKTMHSMEEQFNETRCIETPLPRLPFGTQEKTGQKINPDEEFPAWKAPGALLAGHFGRDRAVLF